MRKLNIALLILLLFIVVGCQPTTEAELRFSLNPGIDTIEINTVYSDPGATATYNDEALEVVVVSDTVDETNLGTYEIVYQIVYQNKTETLSRYVYVIDETAPLGTLNPGIDNIFAGDTWIDASVSASDNSLDDVMITTEGSVNTDIPGEYIITYLLEDSSGNQTILYRYVFVQE